MKLIYIALYLFAVGLKTKMATAQLQTTQGANAGKKGRVTSTYFVSVVILFIQFVQFWLLTKKFPLNLYFALAGAVLVGFAIQEAVGAFAGFSIGEKRQKIEVLSKIWGLHNLAASCLIMALTSVIMLWSISGSLWEYLRLPIGDPKAVGWIAFYEFILPQVIPILTCSFSGFMMTSEFLDADCRNSLLTAQFSQLFPAAITLLYPVSLYQSELNSSLGFFPSLWLLISLPIISFFLFGVCPYFVGTFRFRAQSIAMLRWRRNWLEELLPWSKVPSGRSRSQGFEEMDGRLITEVKRRIGQHEFFSLFWTPEETDSEIPLEKTERTVTAELPAAEAVLRPSEVAVVPEAAPTLPAAMPVAAPAKAASFTTWPTQMEIMAQFVNHGNLGGDFHAVLEKAKAPHVRELVRQNKDFLVEWDDSFRHMSKLIDWWHITSEETAADLCPFVDAELKKLDQELKRSSAGAPFTLGTIWGVLSGTVVWLSKVFDDKIVHVAKELADKESVLKVIRFLMAQ